MKKICLILGLCSLNTAYAEPRSLPPIINNSSYADGSSHSERRSANQPMLQMLGRVETLQTEIQQLRGQIEEQEYELSNLKKRQRNIYSDINARLEHLETRGRGGIATISRQESEEMPTPSTPIPMAQTQAAIPIQQTLPVEAQTNTGEKAAFDQAFTSVKNSHYHQAIKLFKQFLQDYPVSDYADNATFWLASVYRVVNDLPEAKENFQAVYTQFPNSEKASSAMLKLADIYTQENNLAAARQLYIKITQQYANSSSAQIAEGQLQSLGL